MKRKIPSLDKRHAKHRHLSQDEADLWRKTVEGVDASLPPPEKIKPVVKSRKARPAVKEEYHPDVVTSRTKTALPAEAFDSPTRNKLRRGAIMIDATLDLHGHTQASAHAALVHFIGECQTRGARLLRVITGKGRAGGGALRELVPRWLEETPLRGHILAYDVADLRHGGEGAWYVRIRKGSGIGGRGSGSGASGSGF